MTVTAPDSHGGTIVASDALLTQLESLATLAASLRSRATELARVIPAFEPRASLAYDLPLAALDARRMSIAALQSISAAANHAADLGAGVRSSLVGYETTEELALQLGHQLNEAIAGALGAGFRVFGLPLLLTAAGSVLVGSALTGRSPTAFGGDAEAFLKVHGRILTNPFTVRMIREVASDADGFGEGFLLLPPPVATAVQSSGATGVSSSANVVVGLGRAIGLFEPTAVAVHKTSTFDSGHPPTSLEARAGSFPSATEDPNGEQIRIDRYSQPGKPDRFDVYVGGTVTFNPVTGSEPFDFQSDLAGVGHKSVASYQAVVDAMKQAGITPSSPVVLNGYSQGGLVASDVAASGDFNVKGLLTFGAPSAQVHLPASLPVLSVRNSEDLVPATSGYDVNPHAVVVTRSVFADQPVPTDWAVPAHKMTFYQQTAAIVDHSQSSEVRGVLDPLNHFGDGATSVDSTLWVATRVPVGDAVGVSDPIAPAVGAGSAR